MNEGKEESDEEHAFPTSAEDHLGAAVQVTLKDVLLKQSPEWDQQESPTQWVIQIETGDKDDQRDREERGKQQEFRRCDKVVSTKAEFPHGLAISSMRKDHEGECERDRDREYDFVRTNERHDHPLGDQTRDNYGHDLPQSERRSP